MKYRLHLECTAEVCRRSFVLEDMEILRFDDGDPEFPSHFYYVFCPHCHSQVPVWQPYDGKTNIRKIELGTEKDSWLPFLLIPIVPEDQALWRPYPEGPRLYLALAVPHGTLMAVK